MSRRSDAEGKTPVEEVPGGGISPAVDAVDADLRVELESDTDIAPGASEESAKVIASFIHEAEEALSSDRGRQTLIGATVVARAIVFAAVTISNAIRESRNTPS